MLSSDFVVHGQGEPALQRTSGAVTWGLLVVNGEFLKRHFPNGKPFPPRGSLAFRAPARQRRAFVRLFTKIVGLAEARPAKTSSPAVAQKLEQTMLHMLLPCFREGEQLAQSAARRWHVSVVNQLATVLSSSPDRRVPIEELCAALVVSDRMLRICCQEILGMSPTAYMRLCRLARARDAIIAARPGLVSIANVARQFGFTEAGRFSGAYRLAFGEAPSATLLDSR